MKNKYIAITIAILIVIMIAIFGNIFLIRSIDVVFTRPPKNTDEAAVVAASKIALSSNIFAMDEDKSTRNITSYFPNNTVAVLGIERVFPNKVIIRVKERVPLLLVPYGDDGEECVPTDIDFQMTQKVSIADIDFDAITISGTSVQQTFNTSSFRQIRDTLSAFSSLGFNEEAMIAFIKKISLSAEHLRIELRHGDTVFELSLVSEKPLSEQTKQAYKQFLELDYDKRAAAHISIS